MIYTVLKSMTLNGETYSTGSHVDSSAFAPGRERKLLSAGAIAKVRENVLKQEAQPEEKSQKEVKPEKAMNTVAKAEAKPKGRGRGKGA